MMLIRHIQISELVAWKGRLYQELDSSEWSWARTHTKEAIERELELGVKQLWTIGEEVGAPKLLAMTMIEHHPAAKILKVVWASGADAKEAVETMPKFVAFAATIGIDWVDVQGRPGWDKLLAPFGFKEQFRTYGRRVSGGMMQ